MDTQNTPIRDTIESIKYGDLHVDDARSRILIAFATLFEWFLEVHNCAQVEQLIQRIKTLLFDEVNEFRDSASVPTPPPRGSQPEDVFRCLVHHGKVKKIPRECFIHVILFAEYRWLYVRLQPDGAENNLCDSTKTAAIVRDCYWRNLHPHIIEVLNTPKKKNSTPQAFYETTIRFIIEMTAQTPQAQCGYVYTDIKMTNDDIIQKETIVDYVEVMIKKLTVWEIGQPVTIQDVEVPSKEKEFEWVLEVEPMDVEEGRWTKEQADQAYNQMMSERHDHEFQLTLSAGVETLAEGVQEEQGLQVLSPVPDEPWFDHLLEEVFESLQG